VRSHGCQCAARWYPWDWGKLGELRIAPRSAPVSLEKIKSVLTTLSIPRDMSVMPNQENVARVFNNTFRVVRRQEDFYSIYNHEQLVSGSLEQLAFWLWANQPDF
jgi:hypothetical protein